MKRISLIGLLITVIFQSCAPSNSVSGGFIQKRKYTKGFHIAKKGKVNSKKEKVLSNDYTDRGDHDRKCIVQRKRELIEIDPSKRDLVVLKNEEESQNRVNEIVDKKINYDRVDDVEEQCSEGSNRNLSKISNDRDKSVLTLGIEKKDDGESEVSDSAQRRSEIIQGLSIASMVFSTTGLFFIILWLFYSGGLQLIYIFWGIGIAFVLIAVIFLALKSKEATRSDRVWVITAGATSIFPIIATFLIVLVFLLFFFGG